MSDASSSSSVDVDGKKFWMRCAACQFSIGTQGDAVPIGDGNFIHKKCSKLCGSCQKNILIKDDALKHNDVFYHLKCAPAGAKIDSSGVFVPSTQTVTVTETVRPLGPAAGGSMRKPRPDHPMAKPQVNLF